MSIYWQLLLYFKIMVMGICYYNRLLCQCIFLKCLEKKILIWNFFCPWLILQGYGLSSPRKRDDYYEHQPLSNRNYHQNEGGQNLHEKQVWEKIQHVDHELKQLEETNKVNYLPCPISSNTLVTIFFNIFSKLVYVELWYQSFWGNVLKYWSFSKVFIYCPCHLGFHIQFGIIFNRRHLISDNFTELY